MKKKENTWNKGRRKGEKGRRKGRKEAGIQGRKEKERGKSNKNDLCYT